MIDLMIPFQTIYFLNAFSFPITLILSVAFKASKANKKTKTTKTTMIKMKPNKFSSGLKLVKPAEENSCALTCSSTVLFEEKLRISYFFNHNLISLVGRISNSATLLSDLI